MLQPVLAVSNPKVSYLVLSSTPVPPVLTSMYTAVLVLADTVTTYEYIREYGIYTYIFIYIRCLKTKWSFFPSVALGDWVPPDRRGKFVEYLGRKLLTSDSSSVPT